MRFKERLSSTDPTVIDGAFNELRALLAVKIGKPPAEIEEGMVAYLAMKIVSADETGWIPKQLNEREDDAFITLMAMATK